MIAAIPVLEDMNGYYIITIYESTTDGHFKRTAKRPFKVLAGLIAGVSAPIGTIEMNPRSRASIHWRTPTVISHLERRPQSVFKFFRNKLYNRQYYIATVNDNVFRTNVLNLHEINFKPGISPSIKKVFSDKFIDAMHLWGISKKAYRR